MGGGRHVYYLNSGDGFMSVYIYQNINFYTSNICSFSYVSYVLRKLQTSTTEWLQL